MSLPTAGERSLLQQHLNTFSVYLENQQIYLEIIPVSVCNMATSSNSSIKFSHNVFDINNDNDRCLFVAVNILHELVHCFEPVHVTLEENKLLFCSLTNGQHLQDAARSTFEQGEIFEVMMFGGIFGRADANTLEGYCSKSDMDFLFVINDHCRYRHFFHSYDLKIIYNIINRKKDVFSFTTSFVQLVDVSLIFFDYPEHK